MSFRVGIPRQPFSDCVRDTTFRLRWTDRENQNQTTDIRGYNTFKWLNFPDLPPHSSHLSELTQDIFFSSPSISIVILWIFQVAMLNRTVRNDPDFTGLAIGTLTNPPALEGCRVNSDTVPPKSRSRLCKLTSISSVTTPPTASIFQTDVRSE